MLLSQSSAPFLVNPKAVTPECRCGKNTGEVEVQSKAVSLTGLLCKI